MKSGFKSECRQLFLKFQQIGIDDEMKLASAIPAVACFQAKFEDSNPMVVQTLILTIYDRVDDCIVVVCYGPRKGDEQYGSMKYRRSSAMAEGAIVKLLEWKQDQFSFQIEIN
jgi:hypothetical protein